VGAIINVSRNHVGGTERTVGERTTISGHIQEPWYTPGGDAEVRLLRRANSLALRDLPIADSWPFLHRDMFVRTRQGPSGASSSFRGTVVHFGGSFSHLHHDLREWRLKFEELLRRMYWEHAAVLVVTEYLGAHHYLWRPTEEATLAMFAPTRAPISAWDLSTSPGAL
jgi:hypothetical protein